MLARCTNDAERVSRAAPLSACQTIGGQANDGFCESPANGCRLLSNAGDACSSEAASYECAASLFCEASGLASPAFVCCTADCSGLCQICDSGACTPTGGAACSSCPDAVNCVCNAAADCINKLVVGEQCAEDYECLDGACLAGSGSTDYPSNKKFCQSSSSAGVACVSADGQGPSEVAPVAAVEPCLLSGRCVFYSSRKRNNQHGICDTQCLLPATPYTGAPRALVCSS